MGFYKMNKYNKNNKPKYNKPKYNKLKYKRSIMRNVTTPNKEQISAFSIAALAGIITLLPTVLRYWNDDSTSFTILGHDFKYSTFLKVYTVGAVVALGLLSKDFREATKKRNLPFAGT